MIVELMIYTLAVSLLMGLAALAIDGAAGLAKWPRRWVWAGAMVISLAGAATMERRTTHAPAAPSGVASTVATVTRQIAEPGMPFPPLGINSHVRWSVGPKASTVAARVQGYAKALWLGTSMCLLGVYLVGAIHLIRARRTWTRQSVGKYEVLVTPDTGPAVLGLIRPVIVVPRWILNEAPATRDAVLSHENQHVAARDPILLLIALLLLALTPWNLPLWWQLRRLKLAIELDCDSRVLGQGVDRRTYADTLLRINQYAGTMPLGAVAIVGRASQTERRIRAIMSAPPRYWRLCIVGLGATALPILVAAAALNPPSSAPAAPHVYLGIGVGDLDVNAEAASITAVRHGAIVTAIRPGSVAEQAGLKRGDLIIEFGSTTISSARALSTAAGEAAPDARIPLVIQRAGVNRTFIADFSIPPLPPTSSGQIQDASDWDSLRDAHLPIGQPGLRDELIRMANLDQWQSEFKKQSTRLPSLPPDTSGVIAAPRMDPAATASNMRRLKQIVAQYGWPTVSMVGVRGSTAAALIAIGARNDPAFQGQVLGLMESLLPRDEVPTMYYASLFDTVHTPQRYGTFGECVNGINQPSKPVEDLPHLEERRGALGLPKIPKFCVSTRAYSGGD